MKVKSNRLGNLFSFFSLPSRIPSNSASVTSRHNVQSNQLLITTRDCKININAKNYIKKINVFQSPGLGI